MLTVRSIAHRLVLSSVLATAASLSGGCAAPPVTAEPATGLTVPEMRSRADALEAEGNRLRAAAAARRSAWDTAGADQLAAAATKKLTEAKLLRDQALLTEAKPKVD